MKLLVAVFAMAVLVMLVATLFAFPTMWLVNYVLSDVALAAVFGGPIGFGKALCLNALCGLVYFSRVE